MELTLQLAAFALLLAGSVLALSFVVRTDLGVRGVRIRVRRRAIVAPQPIEKPLRRAA